MIFLKRAKKKGRKPMVKWPVTILYDDREKKGRWNFRHEQFVFRKKRLKIADYTIKGLEDIVAVERKSGFAEFIQNIKGAANKRSLEKKLAMLSEFPIKAFVIEEDADGILRTIRSNKHIQVPIDNVQYWVTRIMVHYEIPVLLLNSNQADKDTFLYHLFDGMLEKGLEYL